MPPGETTEEHRKLQQEEAATVELDKANHTPGGGLFRGRFRCFARAPRRTAPVIRDVQDGVNRCPHCMWELEEGECRSCGYTHVTDDMGFLSDSRSSSLSEIYAQQTMENQRLLAERRRLLRLEDRGSDIDYFSDTDISFTDHADRIYGGIDVDELAEMGSIPRRGRNRRRILAETDEEHSSADDEDAGSLDGFVVNDVEEPPDWPDTEPSVPDGWGSEHGLSPRIRSPQLGSPSTHYDTEEISAMDEGAGTYLSEDDGFTRESSLSRFGIGNDRLRPTHLGRNRAREGRARARSTSENSRLNQSDQGLASAVHMGIQDESEDVSDATPIVRTRRRARIQRLSSSSASDSGRLGRVGPRRPFLYRRYSNSPSTPHPNPASNERGSGSSNGTSRGVPIEIESDSDSPIPPRRSRAWRTANPEFSDDNQVSAAGNMVDWAPTPHSSSGTATVGRQSPARNTAMTPDFPPPSTTSNPVSPILIGSSPINVADLMRTGSPYTRRNESSATPPMSPNRFAARYVRVPPPASTDRYMAAPQTNSPRPRRRIYRIPSRSPRQPSTNPSGNTLPSGNSNPASRPMPINEVLSGAEQRQQQAASGEAARKAARKAEKKRLKRERRQREQNRSAANTPHAAGGVFDRRW